MPFTSKLRPGDEDCRGIPEEAGQAQATRIASQRSSAEISTGGTHRGLIGNSTAERMNLFGHFETLLHLRFPKEQLVFRNFATS